MKRNVLIGNVWGEIEKMRKALGLPERCEAALMDATFGYKVRNKRYRQEQEISDVVASRDLKRLTDEGMLVAFGEKRGRYHEAAAPLKTLLARFTADSSRAPSPYDVLKSQGERKRLAVPWRP